MNTMTQNAPSTLTLFRQALVEMTPAWLRGPATWLLLAFMALEFGPGILGPKHYTMMWVVTDGRHTGYVMGTLPVMLCTT